MSANSDISDDNSGVLSGDDIWGEEPAPKRKCNRKNWTRNIAKLSRDSRKAYTSVTTKKEIAAKSVGPPCDCKNKCFSLVGEENVKLIFDKYWKMASHNSQTSYIVSRVRSKEVARRYAGPSTKRNVTNEYSVMVNNKSITVCRTAFCNIHAVTKKRVANALAKVGETGTVALDLRGTATSVNKTPEENVQLVSDHIKSLPTCSSHYSRAKSRDRVYLPPGYSQQKCYDLYVEKCREDGVSDSIVKFWKYKEMFRQFNIGVDPPKCDTCTTCDRIGVQTDRARREEDQEKISQLAVEKKVHLVKASIARHIMKVYTSHREQDLFAVAIDLQQTLPTPRLTTNVQYYKRKLWTYNFCIHNLREKTAHLYVWNETIAKRGSSEIGSCLIHYINNYVPENMTKFVIFSDNCSGQNKNINLCLLLLRFIHNDRFGLIKQYYLTPGHSYLPCDQDFGNLELALKGKEVYSTPHYVSLMKEARRERPFTVVEMDANNFFDLEPLQSLCTKVVVSRSGFKNARMFSFRSDFRQGMGIVKTDTEDFEHPTPVKLQKGRGATYDERKFNLAAVHLPLKYPQGVRITKEKIEDLNLLLDFIPADYLNFYNDIFAAQGLIEAEGGVDRDEIEDPDDDILDF